MLITYIHLDDPPSTAFWFEAKRGVSLDVELSNLPENKKHQETLLRRKRAAPFLGAFQVVDGRIHEKTVVAYFSGTFFRSVKYDYWAKEPWNKSLNFIFS